MDDPDEKGLSKFLSENGLSDVKWLKWFQKKNITKVNQILAVEGDEDVYQSLSLDANPAEREALSKILKLRAPIDTPDESIDTVLKGVNLEPSYWSRVIDKQLGIKSPQALQYVGEESYQLLIQFVRKPWEKKALRKLLKLESEESSFQKQRQKRKEIFMKRQTESAEALKILKALEKEGKGRHEKIVQEMEQGFRERLQIPDSLWLQKDATLTEVIRKMEAMHDNISGTLKDREDISEVQLITTASSGLALRGILITRDQNDVLNQRRHLLRASDDLHLDGPSHPQHDKIQQFSSKKKEDEFSKRVEMLGYSSSASIKAGYWGIGLEASTSYTKKNEEDTTNEQHKEETYSSTVKYSVMPLASCSFKDHQLQLSNDAVSHLQRINDALGNMQSVQDECETFLKKFGSHVCTGPLHFGGKYEWKSFSSGFKESEKSTVQVLQSEVISAQISMSYGNIAGGSMSVSDSSMKGNFSGKYSEALTSNTLLGVTITGGPPEVTGLPDWKNGLVASNSTWYLIDRGTEKVPVWDIIEMNYATFFQNSKLLVKKMKQTWEQFNELESESPMRHVTSEVKEVIEYVTSWNENPENPDHTQLEKQLAMLVDRKEKIAREFMNPQVWAADYLSQPPLQQFLRMIVGICLKNPSECLKRYMRQLVEPIDLDNTRVFPNQESIRKWLYGTDELTPPIECQDFLSVHKYFKLSLECMQGGVYDERSMEIVIQPDAAIQAMATVAKAIYCLRTYLQKTGQKYEDCFVTTMLYPLKYDHKKFRFLVLMTASDVNYLCKHFEIECNAFFSIKKQKSLTSLQAYLFSLTIRLYINLQLDVSETHVKQHLQYLKQKIGDDIKPEVSDSLVEFESEDYDWEWLQNELQSLVQGIPVKPVTVEGGKPLEDVLAQERGTPIKQGLPCQPKNLLKPSKGVEELLSQLHLCDFFPQKLTLSQALQIREDTLDTTKVRQLGTSKAKTETDTETSKTTEAGQSDDAKERIYCSDPHLYPFLILQKIVAFDHRCRVALTSDSPDKFLSQDENSSDSESDSSDDDEEKIEIHPMDGLLALLHCSDNFLRQDLMSRLATCQLAVPILLPDPITHEPTFLLWAMRFIVKEFKVDDGASYSGPIVSYPAPIVSFLRLGCHSKSKSRLLNTIINTTEHTTFFHYDCDGGGAKKVLMNGVVELSWYLPSKSDKVFPKVVSFTNLHGDARDYSKQVQFLSEVSVMHFVFLNEGDFDDNAVEVLKSLSQAPGGVVILQTEQAKTKSWLKDVEQLKEKLIIVKLFHKNESAIKNKIQKIVRSKISAVSDQTLEDIAKNCGIATDEQDSDCVKGKELAYECHTSIETFTKENPDKSPKQLLVLQSSGLWHKWAAMDKEQYRQNQKGQTPMLEYGELQRKKMDLIRKKQLTNAINLGPLMASFLTTLLTNQGDIVRYYLQWLKLILDDLSRELLPPLHNQYQKKRKELNDIQMQEKKDEKAENICRGEMNVLNMELINASFGLEHMLREISQMYEAVISQEGVPQNLKNQIFRLPEIAARLLVDGFPLELMDGDAAHVPQKWVSAVLEKVSKIIKDKTSDASNPQIFVLSVLGLQSTGKSTMMNTLFGVQFAVSAGRCTRGAFMQLLPVHESLQKKCGFQYFLIIDTEGLRAPELDALQMQKHDNELATFVIGMANLTIMNIKGEISGDMNDILQTTVHAFLRMNKVKLRPSCHFVYQNVAAVAASEKAMMGRFKVKDMLDKMTQEAAIEADLEVDYRCFNQVIKFDYENDVSFFPDLWTGSPPMAPVSPEYSVEAQALKHRLIRYTKMAQKSRDNTISQLNKHLSELWKAVLQENFVFSFKNTFEIAAYTTLDVRYGDCSWSFKKQMTKWEQTAQNELKSCTIEDLSSVYKELTKSLPQGVSEIYDDCKTRMDTFFEESPEQDIISKWKYDTELRLRSLTEKLETHAEQHCTQFFNSRRSRADADSKKENLSKLILERVQNMVSKLEKGKLSEEKLKDMFEESWIGWMVELTPRTEQIKPLNVKSEVENSVRDIFRTNHQILLQKLSDPVTGKPLEKWGNPLKLTTKGDYLKLLKSSSLGGRIWGGFKHIVGAGKKVEDFFPSARQETESILKEVEDYLTKKRHSDENFNPNFTTELLLDLLHNVGKVKSDQYQFTAEYKVDLALTACGYAIHIFEGMEKAFREKHDPIIYIETEMKMHCWKLFVNKYNQIAQEKTAADTVCRQLWMPIRRQVLSRLSVVIPDNIRGTYPWIKSKPSLKAHILLDIGERLEDDRHLYPEEIRHGFHDCGVYLKDAKRSLKEWIKHYTDEHCDSGSPAQISTNALDELRNLIIFIKNSAKSVTRLFSPDLKNFHLNDWLTVFHAQVKGTVALELTTLCVLGGNPELENVEFFTDEIVRGLDSLHSVLTEECKDMNSSQMKDWKQTPYEVLYNEVAGCTEQCPFCEEQCDHTADDHLSRAKHSVQHRPKCLGGYSYENDNTMSLKLCTLSVAGNDEFRNRDTNKKYHPYKRYADYYPHWSIPPDMSVDASKLWKWLVGNFSTEIEELFGCSKTEIPNEWKQLKWAEAKEWLTNEYNV